MVDQRWYRTGDFGHSIGGGRVKVLGRADKTEINISAIKVNLNDVRHSILELNKIQGVH